MSFSTYTHAEKTINCLRTQAAASKQSIYLEGVMEVERLACLRAFQFEDFPKHLLVLHFDKNSQ